MAVFQKKNKLERWSGWSHQNNFRSKQVQFFSLTFSFCPLSSFQGNKDDVKKNGCIIIIIVVV